MSESILQKYGLDLRGQRKRKDGKRLWGAKVRMKIAQLGREHGAKQIAEDIGIRVDQVRRWMKDEPIPGMEAAPNGNGAAALHNGLPVKPKSKAERKRKGAISFQCENIESAITVLTGLLGRPGRVSIIIE